MDLGALAINCTLKRSGEGATSSTDVLLAQLLEALAGEGVRGELLRAADYAIAPGVTSEEGPDDAWPTIREKVLAADILAIGTPIWMGQPSSVAKRVMERLNAFLQEQDEAGRMVSYGRVGLVASVGNEDGAHHVAAAIYQGLNDCGFTLAANATTYWVGEAMGAVEFKDFDRPPEAVANQTRMAARNAAHLARLLRSDGYPGER